MTALRAVDRQRQLVHQPVAVRQARQRIIVGQPIQFFLVCLQLGDVAHRQGNARTAVHQPPVHPRRAQLRARRHAVFVLDGAEANRALAGFLQAGVQGRRQQVAGARADQQVAWQPEHDGGLLVAVFHDQFRHRAGCCIQRPQHVIPLVRCIGGEPVGALHLLLHHPARAEAGDADHDHDAGQQQHRRGQQRDAAIAARRSAEFNQRIIRGHGRQRDQRQLRMLAPCDIARTAVGEQFAGLEAHAGRCIKRRVVSIENPRRLTGAKLRHQHRAIEQAHGDEVARRDQRIVLKRLEKIRQRAEHQHATERSVRPVQAAAEAHHALADHRRIGHRADQPAGTAIGAQVFKVIKPRNGCRLGHERCADHLRAVIQDDHVQRVPARQQARDILFQVDRLRRTSPLGGDAFGNLGHPVGQVFDLHRIRCRARRHLRHDQPARCFFLFSERLLDAPPQQADHCDQRERSRHQREPSMAQRVPVDLVLRRKKRNDRHR